MSSIAKKAAFGSALALGIGLALPAVSSAAPPLTGQVQFSAVDNGDCSATFTIVNQTNSDRNRVAYWTGENVPDTAPAYGALEDDQPVALYGDPASDDGAGNTYDSTTDGAGYHEALVAVTTEKTVDFSDAANGSDTVEVGYAMYGIESGAYDNSLKTVTVTGCGDDAADPGMFGSLGSLDFFGSLS